MERKCLVADSVHPSLFPLLESIGWTADYLPESSREEIKTKLQHYSGLIIRSKTYVDHDLVGDHPTIKFVGRAGAGLDNLDVKFLRSKNIEVIHAAEGNKDAVAEFALGMLISLLRNIPRADDQVRNFVWDREGNRGEEIMGKTIGIIGYGNMGRAFAQRLSGFGCKILAYDKYKSRFGDNICQEVQMQSIFAEADIVSFHIPLTSETRGMVDSAYFERFSKKIVIVNTARGEIIPLVELANALMNGKVRGAALDVLENEKITNLTETQLQSFKYLTSHTNVIFTPHIAGWTFESHEKINVALVNKIKSLRLLS
jgi:D-3-phosphoglycerate dehydrogenase / 2-oxoglutarate reductase